MQHGLSYDPFVLVPDQLNVKLRHVVREMPRVRMCVVAIECAGPAAKTCLGENYECCESESIYLGSDGP